jgi:bisphosphoglycerate-independent phosphoglycerate mutase (AlkP superfamily)
MSDIKRLLLITIDGIAFSTSMVGNALELSKPKYFNYLIKNYPVFLMKKEQSPISSYKIMSMGRFSDDNGLIMKKFESENIGSNQNFKNFINCVKSNLSPIHLIGAVGENNSDDKQILLRLLDCFKKEKIRRVYLHLILDFESNQIPRAIDFIDELEQNGVCEIATIVGSDIVKNEKHDLAKGRESIF